MERIYGFAPVYAPDAQLLILGSMPSVQSLAQGFYYAHPRNAFWRILADVWQCPLPETIADKKHMLLAHRVALWDSIASCERPGSLDSDIRQAQVNDFAALFESCSEIRRICFNGQTAYKQFFARSRALLDRREVFVLPSTSPAHTMKYETKLELWRQAILWGEGVKV